MDSKLTALFSIIIALVLSYPIDSRAGVFEPGEELEYEVSYIGIRLGTVKVYSEAIDTVNGKPLCRAKAYMDSRDGLPFVDLHAIFKTWADTSLARSHKFEGNVKVSDDRWDFQKIFFRKDSNRVINYKWHGKKQVRFDTLISGDKIADGLSLFFIARQYCGKKKKTRVPTVIDKKIEYTSFEFTDKKEAIEIDSVPYPIRTSYFSGEAEWDGIYGITGGFEGWFSDDEARIPIYAKMEVYLGSVRIELVKWKRKNWKAPKAEEED